MDLYSLEKFKKYKSDWNYPIQIRYQEKVVANKKCPVTFQAAIKGVLIVGQIFALNPVLGICENDASKLRFRFTSWRCAYSVLSLICQTSMTTLLFFSLFKESSTVVDAATNFIFNCFGFVTTILFLRIAMKWPKLCVQISKIEATDPNTDTKLKFKFNVIGILVMSLALLEHLLFKLHSISITAGCDSDKSIYENYIMHTFSWVFLYLPYNTFVGVFCHLFNIQCTFNWNFCDLFVICMSLYLTSRLEQVNRRVVAAKDKNSPSSFWRTIREDYNRSVQLVREVDNIIGGIVFISFASNLFFICSQLLHTLAGGMNAVPECGPQSNSDLRILFGYEHSLYFAYSFAFLVARSLTVSLTAARVHAASLEPAYSLYDVSSATFCVEIERFLGQIHGDTVALSGLQFFNVKRGLVLTIAGTIVTYELVLMQFTGVTPTTPEPTT